MAPSYRLIYTPTPAYTLIALAKLWKFTTSSSKFSMRSAVHIVTAVTGVRSTCKLIQFVCRVGLFGIF